MVRKRILVAYDGTEQAFWALQHAAQTASATNAEIGVVTVMPPIIDAPGEALRYLLEHGIEAEIHVPIGTDARSEIARIAAESGYDEVFAAAGERS